METTQTNTASVNLPDEIRQQHIPSLDGLRGIAIIMVVMGHLHFSWNYAYTTIFNGPLGVNIFFVISGFLITTLCLKEKLLTGTLSLKNFYIRRILRIIPVAYLYVAVVFILDHFYGLNNACFQYLAALFFVMNFSYFRKNQDSAQLGHFWSLSIEEQFYILFPFLLKKNQKLFNWSIVFIVVVLPLVCAMQEFVPAINKGLFYYFTHYLIKFQSIAVGCLLALSVFNKAFKLSHLRSFKVMGNIAAIVLIFTLGYDGFYTIKTVYVNLAIACLIAYIIASNIMSGDDFIYRALNSKALSIVGKLSYSIYLWQQLFTIIDPRLPAVINGLPTNLIFLIVVTCLSYFIYERYFLNLKKRFSLIK